MRQEAAVAKKDKKQKGKRKSDKKRKRTMAEKADRHALYEDSVQCPEEDVEFFGQTFEKLRGRRALVLREDFCGTAKMAVEWCLSHPDRTAIGVDLHQPTIDWGREHHVLPNARKLGDRLTVYTANVLEPRSEKADVTCACNFSFCVFKKREELKDYLTRARDALADDGLLFLEIYGGTEAVAVADEERDCDGYEYVWDQHRFNPLTAETLCYIHYRFPDGSRLEKAFTYDWRLWSIPELVDLLSEVGFADTKIFWEQLEDDEESDDDEEMLYGNGEYDDVTGKDVEQQESFLVYVVGVK